MQLVVADPPPTFFKALSKKGSKQICRARLSVPDLPGPHTLAIVRARVGSSFPVGAHACSGPRTPL